MPFDGAPITPSRVELIHGHVPGFSPCELTVPSWCVAALAPPKNFHAPASTAERLNAQFPVYATNVRFVVLEIGEAVARKAIWQLLREYPNHECLEESAVCGWAMDGFSIVLASLDPVGVSAGKQALSKLVSRLGVTPVCDFDCHGFHPCMSYVAPPGLRSLLGRLPDCIAPSSVPMAMEHSQTSF